MPTSRRCKTRRDLVHPSWWKRNIVQEQRVSTRGLSQEKARLAELFAVEMFQANYLFQGDSIFPPHALQFRPGLEAIDISKA